MVAHNQSKDAAKFDRESLFAFTAALILTLSSVGSAQSFRFAVWGDSQFQHPERFEEIVLETAALDPDFALHVGDMIHGYTYAPEVARREWARFKRQIAPLRAPFHPTPGNHDVTVAEMEAPYAEAWGEDKFGYAFAHKNAYAIVLDSYLDQAYDTLLPKELARLKTELERGKAYDHIFITTHSPLWLRSEYDWQGLFRDLFADYPVSAVFAGHWHIYDHREIDGVHYFCLNSSGNTAYDAHLAGRSRHWLLANVDGDEASYAVFADGTVYPPDAVPPDEYKRAGGYWNPDGAIVVEPTDGRIDTTALARITNRAPEARTFSLRWVASDERWRIDQPWLDFDLAAESDTTVAFRIEGPGEPLARVEYPYLRVAAPYVNSAGAETLAEWRYELFSPPVARAERVAEPPAIDGELSEPTWSEPSADAFVVDFKNTPASEPTEIFFRYDDETLYVGARMTEPNPDGLAAGAYGEIPLVFGDDDVELFFDADLDRKTFHRLMVNPKGTTLSSGPEGLSSFDFVVATAIGEDYWSAEFAIPFAELGRATPTRGERWGANMRRHRTQADPPQSDWSKMRTHPPYELARFGRLVFD